MDGRERINKERTLGAISQDSRREPGWWHGEDGSTEAITDLRVALYFAGHGWGTWAKMLATAQAIIEQTRDGLFRCLSSRTGVTGVHGCPGCHPRFMVAQLLGSAWLSLVSEGCRSRDTTPHWLHDGAKCCCLILGAAGAPPHPCRPHHPGLRFAGAWISGAFT